MGTMGTPMSAMIQVGYEDIYHRLNSSVKHEVYPILFLFTSDHSRIVEGQEQGRHRTLVRFAAVIQTLER